jgi:hypothetical protein
VPEAGFTATVGQRRAIAHKEMKSWDKEVPITALQHTVAKLDASAVKCMQFKIYRRQ